MWNHLPGSSIHFSCCFHWAGFGKMIYFFWIMNSAILRWKPQTFAILRINYFLWSLIDLPCSILAKAFKAFVFWLPSRRFSFHFMSLWIIKIFIIWFRFLFSLWLYFCLFQCVLFLALLWLYQLYFDFTETHYCL